MKQFCTFGILVIVTALAACLAHSEPAPATGRTWETAACSGVRAMNHGDAKTFNACAHPEFKELMRGFLVERLKEDPQQARVDATLKSLGVKTIRELEELPIDSFIGKMIPVMSAESPPAIQQAMRESKFTVQSSAPYQKEMYQVIIKMETKMQGRPIASDMTIITKKHGDAWLYYGDPETIALYKTSP